ncbi:MAG: SpoVR family protein [Patescibacteria group bacterium]|mgnify:FL=1
MQEHELKRLKQLEKEIKRIAESEGLKTTDIIFEIAPARRVIEGMAYNFPVNFSHWSFGRDYDRIRTIYEHTGGGIPYEQVWNFDTPKAFLAESNPFALQVLVIAHVYAHVDFFLSNCYCQRSRLSADIASQARNAAARFRKYEERHGKEVEKIIDAGFSIQWHQHPDYFRKEPEEERVLEYLREKLRNELIKLKNPSHLKKPDPKRIEFLEKELAELPDKTPPEPTYDLLNYIIQHSSKLKPWVRDVLSVIRSQARALAPNGATKLLNEGWATYWHIRIMHRLLKEGLITPEEHGVFNCFNAKVTRESDSSFNWYRIGVAFFEHVKERWDKGRFGEDYEECRDYFQKINWDTGANKGTQKIFEVRSAYSDRMAVEDLFSDEFIKQQQIYIYGQVRDADGATFREKVADDPETIRTILKRTFTFHNLPLITIEDGNYDNYQHLYLKHHDTGYELDQMHRDRTLEKIFHLWGRKVYLETHREGKPILLSLEGDKIKMSNNIRKKQPL